MTASTSNRAPVKNVIFDFGNVVIRWRPFRALNGIFASDLDPAQTLFVDGSRANCDGARALGLAAHQFVDANALKAELIERGLL